jgi:hypothetical protein
MNGAPGVVGSFPPVRKGAYGWGTRRGGFFPPVRKGAYEWGTRRGGSFPPVRKGAYEWGTRRGGLAEPLGVLGGAVEVGSGFEELEFAGQGGGLGAVEDGFLLGFG